MQGNQTFLSAREIRQITVAGSVPEGSRKFILYKLIDDVFLFKKYRDTKVSILKSGLSVI